MKTGKLSSVITVSVGSSEYVIQSILSNTHFVATAASWLPMRCPIECALTDGRLASAYNYQIDIPYFYKWRESENIWKQPISFRNNISFYYTWSIF